MTDIRVMLSDKRGTMPDEDHLGFGKYFTDHMFAMDYHKGKGWHSPRIVPYEAFSIHPSSMVLHYGQAIFEGIKAFKTADKRIVVFRPNDYLTRFNRSADILCIPRMDLDVVHAGLRKLLATERNWVPGKLGTSLYIRPFVIANDPYVGVKLSEEYRLFIILSPVGAYYAAGFDPVSIKVEDKYARTIKGGIGEAKTPGNYAASLRAQEDAKKEGFAQVLWLDGAERKYIEEVGTMNIFFKINGEIVTPELDGCILSGITRKTVLELTRDWGMKVSERRISVNEVFEAHAKGQLDEVFGSGTAAVISPVGELSWKGRKIVINNNQTGPTARKLFDTITSIQQGRIADKFGWVEEIV